MMETGTQLLVPYWEREKMHRTSFALAAVGFAALGTAATQSHAALLGAQVIAPTSQTQGRWVWSVFLTFSQADDRLVGVNGFQVTGGTMAGVQHRDYGSGTWNPAWNFNDSPNWAGSDSWVSIDGSYLSSNENTVLGWAGGGSTIPDGAGWSQQIATSGGASPYNDPTIPGTNEIKIMQIAGTTLTPGAFAFRFSFNVDWRETANGAVQSSQQSSSIPAPGALALALAANAFARRRRRSPA